MPQTATLNDTSLELCPSSVSNTHSVSELADDDLQPSNYPVFGAPVETSQTIQHESLKVSPTFRGHDSVEIPRNAHEEAAREDSAASPTCSSYPIFGGC